MVTTFNTDINAWAARYALQNPYTNVIGLVRSLLALSLLITLTFNDWGAMFPQYFEQNIVLTTVIDRINIFYLFGYANLALTLWFCIIVLLLVIAGILPQVTCFFHFWVAFSFFRYCPIVEGGDQIGSILSFVLIPICIFDNRRNHWDNPKEGSRPYINMLSNCIILFIQIQVAALYFHAFAGKLNVEEWINGTVTYYWFTHNVFGFPSWLRDWGESMMHNSFIVTSVTWGTILLEIFLFAALFMNRKRRKYLFFAGITFHLGIIFVHGLVSFFFAMAAALVIYLLPADRGLRFFSNLKRKIYAISGRTTHS